MTPARTLGPDLEDQLSSELFVVSATPQERAELTSPLTITFSKPLRSLIVASSVLLTLGLSVLAILLLEVFWRRPAVG